MKLIVFILFLSGGVYAQSTNPCPGVDLQNDIPALTNIVPEKIMDCYVSTKDSSDLRVYVVFEANNMLYKLNYPVAKSDSLNEYKIKYLVSSQGKRYVPLISLEEKMLIE